MDEEKIITLTADIVSAHVSNNTVQDDDLTGLIQSVYTVLASFGTPVEEGAPQEPAVSIRSSIKPAAIACLECGRKLKVLKRHLSTEHDLSPDEYRTKWSLPRDYPLVAPNYAAQRADLAKKIGLGRAPGGGRKPKSASKSTRKPSVRKTEQA